MHTFELPYNVHLFTLTTVAEVCKLAVHRRRQIGSGQRRLEAITCANSGMQLAMLADI